MESGIYEKIVRQYDPQEECNGYETREKQKALSINVVCGIFYILGSGLILSTVSLVAELCLERISKKGH